MEEETDADWDAREKERQRVLEVAGLIVNQDVNPPLETCTCEVRTSPSCGSSEIIDHFELACQRSSPGP